MRLLRSSPSQLFDLERVMNSLNARLHPIATAGWLVALALWAGAANGADAQGDKSLAQQIFEAMIQVPGANPAFRTAHAKGIVGQGTFTPSKEAAGLSKAAHFQGGSVPVTVRFSNA